MIVREAMACERDEIVALYESSQRATGLPDPRVVPPQELGEKLYARRAIGRYVAADASGIHGHGLIEPANPEHMNEWHAAAGGATFIELGGAFVDPERSGEGIWSELLAYRLNIVRSLGAVPVSVTWASNAHVMRGFERSGGRELARKTAALGAISIYMFE